jgi:hypothetical protein
MESGTQYFEISKMLTEELAEWLTYLWEMSSPQERYAFVDQTGIKGGHHAKL